MSISKENFDKATVELNKCIDVLSEDKDKGEWIAEGLKIALSVFDKFCLEGENCDE